MYKASGRRDEHHSSGYRRARSVLLWLAVFTGWLVAVFSVIDEMCLATACRDTASFTIFGFNMGMTGVAYFSLMLLLLWLRGSVYFVDWAVTVLVFTGIGAELRLLWIQKYIIGGWCPLCVTICGALFIAAMLMTIEKVHGNGPGRGRGKSLLWWLALVVTMIAAGLAIAIAGVKTLT